MPCKTSCDLHVGCFVCRSQSSVLLCSPITNKHLASTLALTQQALYFYSKLLMNDSRPIAANVTRMSMSDGSASANQKGAHWGLTWAEITHDFMVKILQLSIFCGFVKSVTQRVLIKQFHTCNSAVFLIISLMRREIQLKVK